MQQYFLWLYLNNVWKCLVPKWFNYPKKIKPLGIPQSLNFCQHVGCVTGWQWACFHEIKQETQLKTDHWQDVSDSVSVSSASETAAGDCRSKHPVSRCMWDQMCWTPCTEPFIVCIATQMLPTWHYTVWIMSSRRSEISCGTFTTVLTPSSHYFADSESNQVNEEKKKLIHRKQ